MYDVVVIGAGIGGLSAGSLLARRGQRVLVVERRGVPGGCCSAHVEAGYRFDIASSLFYGFGPTGFNANRRVLDELEVELEVVEHDPSFTLYLDGEALPVHKDMAAWRESLSLRFPSLRTGLGQFMEGISHLHDQILKVGFYPLGDASLMELTRMAFQDPSILFTYVPMLKRTVWDFVEPMLAEGDPAEVLAFKRLLDVDLAFGTCTPSDELPLLHAVPILVDRHVGGVFYPRRGGAAAVPEALVRGLHKWGGQIRYHSEVRRILTRGRKAIGVELEGGEQIAARRVICNANIWSLYGELLDDQAASSRQRRAVAALKPTSSAFVVCLGVDADIVSEGFGCHAVAIESQRHSLQDVGIVYVPSTVDPSLAPEGKHAVTLVHLADYGRWAGSSNPVELDRAAVARALEVAEGILPGIRTHSEVVATLSPSDLERALGRRYGAVGGPAHTLGQSLNQRAGNTTPIDGLYLVGDSTYPGEGVVAVTISGITCADQIVLARTAADG